MPRDMWSVERWETNEAKEAHPVNVDERGEGAEKATMGPARASAAGPAGLVVGFRSR